MMMTMTREQSDLTYILECAEEPDFTPGTSGDGKGRKVNTVRSRSSREAVGSGTDQG